MRLLIVIFCLLSPYSAAESDYAEQLRSVYQIRVLDAQADQKSSIGSGFSISHDGYIVTNYHVVESVVNFPAAYRLEVISAAGEVLSSRVVAVDIINDLALLSVDGPIASILTLSDHEPVQGERVLSFGNPMDLGQTIVPGTWNGDVAHRFHRLINFSGALNPGMSGGPSLNGTNQVVGVNVAGYGNNLSLLVPLEAIRNIARRTDETVALSEQISQQLLADQDKRIQVLVNGNWAAEPLAGRSAFAEIADFITCWGASNSDEQDRRTNIISRSCRSQEQIYLNRHIQTGNIEFNQVVIQNIDLSDFQFEYEVHGAMTLGRQSASGTDYLGPMSCDEDFVSGQFGGHKVVVCTRAYKRFAPLFDVYFKVASPPHDGQLAMTYMALEGVSSESAKAVIAKMLTVLL